MAIQALSLLNKTVSFVSWHFFDTWEAGQAWKWFLVEVDVNLFAKEHYSELLTDSEWTAQIFSWKVMLTCLSLCNTQARTVNLIHAI